MWDMIWRLHGQIRAADGVVLGYDMTAALALAEALGVPCLAVAEFLPVIEAVMVRAARDRTEQPEG